MKKDILTSRLKMLLKSCKVSESSDCLSFSIMFDPYIIEDSDSQKSYSFPGGHITIDYNLRTGEVGHPFVEGCYTHPVLAKVDEARQPIYFQNKPNFPSPLRIAQLLLQSTRYLKHCYDGPERPHFIHDIGEDVFTQYLID